MLYCLAFLVLTAGLLVDCDFPNEFQEGKLLDSIDHADKIVESANIIKTNLRMLLGGNLRTKTTTTTTKTTTTSTNSYENVLAEFPTLPPPFQMFQQTQTPKTTKDPYPSLKRAAFRRTLRDSNEDGKKRRRNSLEFVDVDDVKNKRSEYDESEVNLDDEKENLVISNNEENNNNVDKGEENVQNVDAIERSDDAENIEYNDDKVKRLDDVSDTSEDEQKRENAVNMLSDDNIED